MSGGRKRHEEHEEHENHERWLVTYADMVTLLMVLFIVMFAMSQVDERKFYELKAGLADGFGSGQGILGSGESIQSQAGASAVEAVQPELFLSDVPPESREAVSKALADSKRLEEERARGDVANEADRLDDVRRRLMSALRANGLEDDVKATYDERGLVVSLVSRHIVFENDLAELTPRGVQVVNALGPTLASLPDRLEVDGHTNQVDVKPKYYDTDWDLSAARALTVLRMLGDEFDIPAARLTLAAFGHTKPLLPVSDPESQEINKRVDIVVLTQLPPDVAALLADRTTREGSDGKVGGRPESGSETEGGGVRVSGTTSGTELDAGGPVGETPTQTRPETGTRP